MSNCLENSIHEKKSVYLEKSIKQLISYNFTAAKPRVVFTSSPMLTPVSNNQIPKFYKSMVIYLFKRYCNKSYIGPKIRQLKKRVRQHISACIDKILILAEKEKGKRK